MSCKDLYGFKSAKKIDAETLHIRLGGSSYIFVTFIDSIGAVYMESDFGAFGYIWHSIGNKSLKDFFLSADKYYLSTKFTYNLGGDRFSEEFSLSKSIACVKGELAAEGVYPHIRPYFGVFKELEFLEKRFDDTCKDGVSERFVSELSSILANHDLQDLFCGHDFGIYSCIRKGPTPAFLSLRDVVIPAIKEAIKNAPRD